MKKIYLFSLVALLFFSCKDEEPDKMTVSGQVKSPNQQVNVEGVEIKLYAQKITSGTWNTSYSLVASQKTNANGEFSLAFDAVRASAFRIELNKEKYYEITSDLDPSKIEKGKNYNVNFDVYPEAYLKIFIKNISPINSADKIKCRFINNNTGCSQCCSDTICEGMNVDAIKRCKTYGAQNVNIDCYITKNNEVTIKNYSIYATPFDTTSIDISY